MPSLKNFSIRAKQNLIIMLTSSVALLLACAAFVAYDSVAYRRELIENVAVLAEAIGNNCAGAIDFNDPKNAREILAALRANENIVAACVYSHDGKVFAVYQREADSLFAPPAVPSTSREEFAGKNLNLFRPIKQRGQLTGTIYVASDLKNLSTRLTRYLGIVGFVFLASSLLAFVLSSRLQRLISGPILDLLQTARTVAAEKNYSVRAVKQSSDEVGRLVDGFNAMLTQIQTRDSELHAAKAQLEKRVEDRTLALKKAQEEAAYERDLLRSLLDHSPDPIYFKDAQSRFLKASRGLAEKFGLKNPEELVGRTDFDFFSAEHAGPAFADEQEIIRSGRPLIDKIEKESLADGRFSWVLSSKMPLHDKNNTVIGTFGISKDITAIKEAEEKLNAVHKQLLDASRQAGMAEVATNVLHNVGNVLNSVNVSASLVMLGLKKSKISSLDKVVALLGENAHDLGTFMTADPRGRQLPAYLAQLSSHLLADQASNLREMNSLRENIEHIKEIVAMQQSYAKVSGVRELIQIRELVEDSLRMNLGSLGRHGVELVREFQEVPPILVEKHKILQILVNMVRNAKHACDDSAQPEKRVTVRVTDGEGRVRISVIDNGVGIPRENLARIFNHGFTTRKDGHGFGLHSGALAAREMGGTLTVMSEGPGRGATFTLDLPAQTEETPDN